MEWRFDINELGLLFLDCKGIDWDELTEREVWEGTAERWLLQRELFELGVDFGSDCACPACIFYNERCPRCPVVGLLNVATCIAHPAYVRLINARYTQDWDGAIAAIDSMLILIRHIQESVS